MAPASRPFRPRTFDTLAACLSDLRSEYGRPLELRLLDRLIESICDQMTIDHARFDPERFCQKARYRIGTTTTEE